MTYQVCEKIFSVENVCLNYDKPILKDVSFDIHNITRPGVAQGQVISLIGKSGIGKTQLFKILSGLIKPTSGNVLIDEDLHPVKSGQVGVVTQNYILFNHRSVRSNLRMALEGSGVKLSKADIEQIINQYSEEFGILEHLDKYPMQLSGGQRQRVSIIQQILTNNRFLLLDEPFSGLDILVKEKVINLLKKVSLMHEHNTMIIVSHDIESSLAISDRVIVLGKPNPEEGATVVSNIDLAKMGLAWIDSNPISRRSVYKDVIVEIAKHL